MNMQPNRNEFDFSAPRGDAIRVSPYSRGVAKAADGYLKSRFFGQMLALGGMGVILIGMFLWKSFSSPPPSIPQHIPTPEPPLSAAVISALQAKHGNYPFDVYVYMIPENQPGAKKVILKEFVRWRDYREFVDGNDGGLSFRVQTSDLKTLEGCKYVTRIQLDEERRAIHYSYITERSRARKMLKL